MPPVSVAAGGLELEPQPDEIPLRATVHDELLGGWRTVTFFTLQAVADEVTVKRYLGIFNAAAVWVRLPVTNHSFTASIFWFCVYVVSLICPPLSQFYHK